MVIRQRKVRDVVVEPAQRLVHVRRKENQAVLPSLVLLVLAVVVAWGRFGPYSF
jgi:hypothetical protein